MERSTLANRARFHRVYCVTAISRSCTLTVQKSFEMKCFNVATHSVGSSLEAQFFFCLGSFVRLFLSFSFAFVTWNKRRLNIVSLNAICQKCYVLRAKIMIKQKNTGPHSITVTITTFNFQMEYPHKLLCMARSERVSEWVSVRFAFVNVIYFCSVALILPTWANRQEELRKKWGKISCKRRENGDRRERKKTNTLSSLSRTYFCGHNRLDMRNQNVHHAKSLA